MRRTSQLSHIRPESTVLVLQSGILRRGTKGIYLCCKHFCETYQIYGESHAVDGLLAAALQVVEVAHGAAVHARAHLAAQVHCPDHRVRVLFLRFLNVLLNVSFCQESSGDHRCEHHVPSSPVRLINYLSICTEIERLRTPFGAASLTDVRKRRKENPPAAAGAASSGR